MGKLSTHVLDTVQGCPAVGVVLELWQHHPHNEIHFVKRLRTNGDGRTDELLLSAEEMRVGQFEIRFKIGDYFAEQGILLSEPRFLDEVPIRFAIFDSEQGYHVPLLASPWAYSTYRGS